MPGNEIEGRIQRLYQQDDYSQQSEVANANWPGYSYNQGHENQRGISEPLSYGLNSNIGELDSVRGPGGRSVNVSFDQQYTHLMQRPGVSFQPGHQHPKTNEYMLGRDILQASHNQVQYLGEGAGAGFVPHNLTSRGLSILKSEQEYASGDSPTLTTNSERSEITEASNEINFIGNQQQFVRGQLGVSPHHSMQQSGYNEMPLLQQHLMFKQLQELQRQQQLQQLGDSRQHNSVSQLSAAAKQAAGFQFSPLSNGNLVNDTPQMLMNWVQRGASPTGQSVSNRVSFSQEQGQNLRSMGQAPQNFDMSLYGTPITSGRGTMNQYSHMQSMSQDSVNLLTKGSNQVHKPAVQASGLSNSFAGDPYTSPDQVFLPQGAFISKQGFPEKNMYGQVTVPSLNCGSTVESLQQENVMQTNTSSRGFTGEQEQDGWLGISQSNTMHGSSQGLVPLDPMEEKILYNTDVNLWDPALANCNEIGGGGGLGSWSALMQSAVADSSSETGLHEEWSSLSFQNMELTSGNQPANMLDNEKQQGSWADNNMQTASSYNSKPFPLLNDSSISSSFPGFQQPGIQCEPEHRESLQRDESHESNQRSPRSNSEWLEPHQRIDPYSIVQPSSKLEGDINEDMYKRSSDVNHWKRDGDTSVTSFSRSPGQLEQVQASSEVSLKSRQNVQMFNFPFMPNAHIIKTHHETSQQVQDNSKLDYVQQMVSSNKEEDEVIEKQRQMRNSSPVIQNSYRHYAKTYEEQSCYQNDNSYDSKTTDISTSVGRSVDHSGVHLSAGTRQKENTSVAQFDPSGFNPLSEMTDAKPHVAFVDQIYNQASASQRQSVSNSQFPSQGFPQSARQIDDILGEKNQTYVATSQTSQSLSRSHESSPRGLVDDTSSVGGGQSGISQSYMHGSSIAEISSSPTFRRNQFPSQVLFNPHVSGQSSQAAVPSTATRHLNSNLAQSQDSIQQRFVNCDGQQFPILESVPVSDPGFKSDLPPQGGVPYRPHSSWTNNGSLQDVSGMESQKVPAVVPPEEKHALDRGQNPMFSGMLEAPQTGVKNVSDPGGLSSESLLANSNAQDSGRTHSGGHNGLSPTARNLQLIGHALNPSQGFRQNYHLLQQVQAMKNLVTDSSGRYVDVRQAGVMAGQQSVYDQNKDGELISASHPMSLPCENPNVPSLLSEAGENSSIKASPQSALQAQVMVAFGDTDSQSQCNESDGTAIQAEASQANLSMAANWLKQYGNIRIGQVPLMLDAGAAGQFSLFKPSQNLKIHSSVDQMDASDANQSSKVWPGTVANSVPNEPLIAPCGLNLNPSTQSTDILRPKKRKIAIRDQPWHKVTQGSNEVQDFSMAEEEWALASNRKVEKVSFDLGMIQDVPPRFRAKRRLIFTTQFMQHLLGPAPASFLSANAALHYDSVTYFVAKISLGDACSLTCSKKNSEVKPLSDSNTMLDKPEVPNSDDDELFSKVVGDLTDRSKKLEDQLLRLDKAVSILDLRLECQELERFFVINRFAKFHLPRADMSGGSSVPGTFTNASRPCPQRYVTGQPLPKNLPEEVQCLQL